MATMAIQQSVTPRPASRDEFNCKSFYVPNLKAFYKDWPEAVSPHYQELKSALDERIDGLYSHERASVLKQGDFALLTSMWWPRADAKRLKTVAFWLVWLFTWDDEIDQSSSELSSNLDRANAFRHETFHYARYALGVPDEETNRYRFDISPPTNKIIGSLDVIGGNLREVYNKDQIMCLIEEIDYYISCQQHEQARKLAGKVPTSDQYLRSRMGTSAVTPTIALNEFADGQELPRWLIDHPKMRSLWNEVNINLSLSNDMFSLRKEIKHGDLESIIPVLVHTRGMTIQEAIEDTCKELRLNIDRFDQTGADLLAEVKGREPELVQETATFIEGCRYNQTANLVWSLTTTRYGLADMPRDAQGGMTISV